ncbi:MAG: hypothetical protein JO166_09145, partial [Deltaproteobacteria bacterium]|nr:hypothetical protein [Deltaproteobacteria bacterium]
MPLSSFVKIRPRNDALFVSRGRSVLITAPDGFVHSDSRQGLFVHETRLLSKYRYLLNQEEFQPIV